MAHSIKTRILYGFNEAIDELIQTTSQLALRQAQLLLFIALRSNSPIVTSEKGEISPVLLHFVQIIT